MTATRTTLPTQARLNKSLRRSVGSTVARACLLLMLLGVLLRAVQYDDEGWLLAFHYATPWPVLAAFAAFASLGFGLIQRRRLCVATALASLVCTSIWLSDSWKDNTPTVPERTPLRFVYWNAAGPQQRVGKVIAHARRFRADFLAIGEAGSETEETLANWRTTFTGHTVLRLPAEMLIVTTGAVRSCRSGTLNHRGRYNLVELDLQGRLCRVLVVDFDADLTRSRRPAFEALRDLVQAQRDQPLIVLGDFNTPGDSPYFGLLDGTLSDAWKRAGQGLSESWPVPLPVLRLDHVWVSPEMHPLRFQMDWSLLSDHRAQILDVVLEPAR